MSEFLEIVVIPVDPHAMKCPRCWHYHHVEGYFDNLCDRCVHVILREHAEGIRTPDYIEELLVSWRKMKKKWCVRPDSDPCSHINCCRKENYEFQT